MFAIGKVTDGTKSSASLSAAAGETRAGSAGPSNAGRGNQGVAFPLATMDTFVDLAGAGKPDRDGQHGRSAHQRTRQFGTWALREDVAGP